MTRRSHDLARRATLAIALIVVAASVHAQDAASTLVQRVAREWVALADAGNGAACWDAAGKQFKSAITRDRWTLALADVRGPLGAVEQRAVRSTRFEKSIPGAPEGAYAVVVFRTSFAKRADGEETVTLEREPGDVWRVLGYSIR